MDHDSDYSLDEALLFAPASLNGDELDNTEELLLKKINEQIEAMIQAGFEPKYILMNKRNYERLSHALMRRNFSSRKPGLIDHYGHLDIVIWDVPIDYVNVRTNASSEFIYDENTLRGKRK